MSEPSNGFEATDAVWAERKECILATVGDLVGELLHDGRKEDDELPPGMIEAAIARGTVSTAELTACFARELDAALADLRIEEARS